MRRSYTFEWGDELRVSANRSFQVIPKTMGLGGMDWNQRGKNIENGDEFASGGGRT